MRPSLVLSFVLCAAAACSDPYSGCEATRTCAAGGHTGADAGSGAVEQGGSDFGGADDGGGSGGSSGFDSGGQDSAGMGGDSMAGAAGSAGCKDEGQLSCVGPAQKDVLICRRGEWVPYRTCNADQNCDQRSGTCEYIAVSCRDQAPGTSYCKGDSLIDCGPDLVSVDERACEGLCVANDDGAACMAPTCSDGKVQAPEECDDGNAQSGDGCSEHCSWELRSVVAGAHHTCALSEGGIVKCWGDNTFGQLGLGDTEARGDELGEMGAALPAVDLGSHRTAKALFAGRDNTCAILDDDTLKCWGANSAGQLGLGNINSHGDEPGEMGDALTAINLGRGRAARSVAIGSDSICALLDDGTVKCWGDNTDGRLGLGDNLTRGDEAGETVASQPAVPLGQPVKAINVGATHSCTLLEDGSIKCWGGNAYGQLGLGDTAARGDELGEVGEGLRAVDLGMGRSARLVAVSKTRLGLI